MVKMTTIILTDVGHDAADDDLRLVGRDDGLPEVRVVPRVDLAKTLDQRRIGIPLEKFVWQRSVGPYV